MIIPNTAVESAQQTWANALKLECGSEARPGPADFGQPQQGLRLVGCKVGIQLSEALTPPPSPPPGPGR